MPRLNPGEDVRPIDVEVGDDGYLPGIAQELTSEDIDDIAFDGYLSVTERRRQLMGLLEEVRSRRSADFMGDMEEISSHLRDRLAALGNPQESQTLAGSTGMDGEGRGDGDDPANHLDDTTKENNAID